MTGNYTIWRGMVWLLKKTMKTERWNNSTICNWGKWTGQYPVVWLRNPGKRTLGSRQNRKMFPGAACSRTPYNWAFGAYLGNRSIFILDPRLRVFSELVLWIGWDRVSSWWPVNMRSSRLWIRWKRAGNLATSLLVPSEKPKGRG